MLPNSKLPTLGSVVASVIFFLFTALDAAAANNIAVPSSTYLEISAPLQKFFGWGFTPAPADWDGMPTARNPEIVARLFSKSGASVARIVVGKSHHALFPESTRKLDGDAFESYVGSYIRALKKAGMRDYVLSFASPPKWMKKYFSDSPHLYLDNNTLRPDSYRDFTLMIVSILQWIKSEGLPLPAGVSIQEQPDCPLPSFACPPSMPQGCLYDPYAYISLVRQVRGEFDAQGFASLHLIGPETRLAEKLEIYSSTRFFGTILTSTYGTSYQKLRYDSKDKRRLWVKGLAPNTAVNDQEALLGLAQRWTHDLAEMGANYWLWPYGFAQDDTGEVLRFGDNESDSSIFRPLSYLWNSIPKDGNVHRVTRKSGETAVEACGFLISSDGNLSGIIFNGRSSEVVLKLPIGYNVVSVQSYLDGLWTHERIQNPYEIGMGPYDVRLVTVKQSASK